MNIRRNYFIKKDFQFNFASRLVVLLLLESILIAALFLLISRNTMTTGYHHSMVMVAPTQQFFLVPFILITLIVVVGCSLAGLIVFVLLSHRIAGPIYRIEKVLKQIDGGDMTTRFHLRKTDQLVEIKESLNAFISSADERLGRMKTDLLEVEDMLAKTDDPAVLARIKDKILRMRDDFNHFKLTSN